MKSLVTRPIDQLGRVVIPREILKNIGWKLKDGPEDGTVLEFSVNGNSVLLKEYKPTCHCCKNEPVAEVQGIQLCPGCIDKFNQAIAIIDNATKLYKKITG